MNFYYLNNNKQPEENGGNYELHNSNCKYCNWVTNGENYIFIGLMKNDEIALERSKLLYPKISDKIDGCKHCCPSIHKE